MNEFILFTLESCPSCKDIKNTLYSQINNGEVHVVDVNREQANGNLMSVFYTVSPAGKVPAMAVISNGRLRRKAVGKASILELL